jgi:hypothetical protein
VVASLSPPVGNLKEKVSKPGFTVRLLVGIDTGATSGDALDQNVTNGTVQPITFRWSQAAGLPQRVYSGFVEGLIGVHVADAGNDFLIAQEGFHGYIMLPQSLSQRPRREAMIQRLGAQCTYYLVLVLHQPHASELPLICEMQAAVVIQMQNRPGMGIGNCRAGLDQEATGHLEMKQELAAFG